MLSRQKLLLVMITCQWHFHTFQDFLAKTVIPDRPATALAPVTIPALSPSLGRDLPDRTLCPIRALRFYLERTGVGKDTDRPTRLFIAHKAGHKGDIAKATISGWIKDTIKQAYLNVQEEDFPFLTHSNFQARELRAHATSLAFHQHHSLSQIMGAVQWRSQSTFAQFYFRDCPSVNGLQSLGPIVAGQVVDDHKSH